MKPSLSAPISTPRLNSLRDRLEKKPGPQDEPYLDQLMMFLDHPPQDVGDRWKAGAEMCAQWGVATSGTSVWQLYLSYLFEWRIRAVLGEELKDASLHDLRVHFARLVALRGCELLSNPETPAKVVIKLARIEQRKKRSSSSTRSTTITSRPWRTRGRTRSGSAPRSGPSVARPPRSSRP